MPGAPHWRSTGRSSRDSADGFRRALDRELAALATALGAHELTEGDADEAIELAGLANLMTPEAVAGLDAGDLDRLAKALSHVLVARRADGTEGSPAMVPEGFTDRAIAPPAFGGDFGIDAAEGIAGWPAHRPRPGYGSPVVEVPIGQVAGALARTTRVWRSRA